MKRAAVTGPAHLPAEALPPDLKCQVHPPCLYHSGALEGWDRAWAAAPAIRAAAIQAEVSRHVAEQAAAAERQRIHRLVKSYRNSRPYQPPEAQAELLERLLNQIGMP